MTTTAGTLNRSARFAPIWRAAASRRITGAVVVDGLLGTHRHRLVLPAERVAVAHVSYRAFNADFSVETVTAQFGAAPEQVAAALRATLPAVAEAFAIRGKADVRIQVPYPSDSGADVTSAAVWSAIDALLEAANVAYTDASLRALAEHLAAPGFGAMLTPSVPGFGIHDTTTGAFTSPYENTARFGLVIVHQPGSSTAEVHDTGTFPTAPAPGDLHDAARWLEQANGVPASALAGQLLEELARRSKLGQPLPVLGVVGGHSDHDPIVLLADPAAGLTEAQRLRSEIAGYLSSVGANAAKKSPQWKATYVIQGRTL